jgi:putative transposase
LQRPAESADIEGRQRVFRGRARSTPSEVSAFIEEHRERFGVEPICSTLGVSASAYYQRKTGERSARQVEDERLLAWIREVHEASYCAYGYRRTWKALTRAGEQAPRCQVQRLMRANGIQGAKRRGKPWRTTTPDPEARRRPDLVNRDFTASAPNELWVADFVSALLGGARVLQLRDRRVQPQDRGLAVRGPYAHHARARRATNGAQHPTAGRGGPAHSPFRQGLAIRQRDYTQTLADNDVLASVGSTGDAYDNSMAESFVDTFKTELIADRVWQTRSQLELAIVEYISWFNDTRLHENLDDRPPREIEELYAVKRRATITTS